MDNGNSDDYSCCHLVYSCLLPDRDDAQKSPGGHSKSPGFAEGVEGRKLY